MNIYDSLASYIWVTDILLSSDKISPTKLMKLMGKNYNDVKKIIKEMQNYDIIEIFNEGFA